jgi:hypothetical protein
VPKIGAKVDERPYNVRCSVCGCLVEKMVSRFGFNGKPAAHAYRCAVWQHNCGTLEREGCAPYREYEPEAHAFNDGEGGVWEHPGRAEHCTAPECADRGHEPLSGGGERHPGRLEDCESAACEPPF